MKKILSFITTLMLLWGILIFVDYIRAYQGEEKLLIGIDMEVTDEYTLREGLGYSVKKYNYDRNKLTDGQVLKEFSIFDFVISKEIARVSYN